MRILLISHFYKTTPPVGTGSIEYFTDYLANYLSEYGNNEVLVICKTGSLGGKYKIRTTEEDSYIGVVNEEIDKFKPDVIHVTFDDLKLYDILVKLSIPVVYTIMSYARPSQWPYMFVNAPKHFLFISVSTNFESYLLEEFKIAYPDKIIESQKLKTIGLIVDTEKFSTKRSLSRKDYYLYLGLIRKHKAVLEIVKYFKTTNRRLLVAGPVKNIPYCDEVLDEISNSTNIEYVGEITDDISKIKILSEAQALVIATGYSPLEPDCHEAGGTVLLESNACGTPILGYKQGVMESFIENGKNGFLFKNIEEIAGYFPIIEKNKMTDDCIKASLPYSIESISNDYFEVYNSLIRVISIDKPTSKGRKFTL